MEKLVKIDKNGSKHWMDDRCDKCGGTGYIDCYQHVDGGMCFKCEGTGIHARTWIERTPEYEAVLQARRNEREAKRIAALKITAIEDNKAWLAQNGFNEDGLTYVFLGNTYEIKDELKAEGALFNGMLGWHSAKNPANRPTITLQAATVTKLDYTGHIQYNYEYPVVGDEESISLIKYIDKLKDAAIAQLNTSSYVGTVGERLTVTLTLKGTSSFQSDFGYTYIHKLFDMDGNEYIWKTGSMMQDKAGEYFKQGKVTGTVKAHTEYKGIKQTQLTRCKVEVVK